MEELEEILDDIQGLKVVLDKEEVLDYLCYELGHLDQFESEEDKEAYDITYFSILDVLVDLYAGARKSYHRNHMPLKLAIDRNKQVLTLIK